MAWFLLSRGHLMVERRPTSDQPAPRRSGWEIRAEAMTLPLAWGSALRIGRSGDCEILIDAPSVSRHHATIDLEGFAPRILDAGSRHGTEVNGVRIDGPRLLRDGDEIRIGSVTLVVSQRHAVERRRSSETTTSMPTLERVGAGASLEADTEGSALRGAATQPIPTVAIPAEESEGVSGRVAPLGAPLSDSYDASAQWIDTLVAGHRERGLVMNPKVLSRLEDVMKRAPGAGRLGLRSYLRWLEAEGVSSRSARECARQIALLLRAQGD